MPIINLKLDNILSFSNFDINFSYPIKLRNTLIPNENLAKVPIFRYKKLNIFVGANASGKTSLVKCIWRILDFLASKEKNIIMSIVNFNYANSYIEIDITDNDVLHKFKIKTINDKNDFKILVSHAYVNLPKFSSYENKIRDLSAIEDNYMDYIECLNNVDFDSGWHVALPATENNFEAIDFYNGDSEEENLDYLHILNQVLKTLDQSITSVYKSNDADNAYVIDHENIGKIIVQEGNNLSSIPFLSSGTKYGFNIANVIFSIKHHRNEIYLIDEQFSYVNSDVEAAILSTMVAMLGPNEQIFFTTHNSNILSLGFPFHSFYFMKKERENNKSVISISCASLAENRNNVSPKSLLDNDVFASAPNVNRIFEIGENDE